MLEILKINLCSPLTLAFVLGLFAKLLRSELALPKEMVTALSIYLLLALGLKGGVELSHSSLSSIATPGFGYAFAWLPHTRFILFDSTTARSVWNFRRGWYRSPLRVRVCGDIHRGPTICRFCWFSLGRLHANSAHVA